MFRRIITRVWSFIRYAYGTHAKHINGDTDQVVQSWWAPAAVASDFVFVAVALVMAVSGPPLVWVGVAAALVVAGRVLNVVVRITLGDMADPDWAPQSLPRFVGLIFANVIEMIVVVAVLLAAVESIESGNSFRPLIETPGVALMSAAAPFGTSGSQALTGWAQLVSLTGSVLLLFMAVVVIAAAVNGAYAERNKPSTLD